MKKYNCVEYIPRDMFNNAEAMLAYKDSIGNLFSDAVTKFFNDKTVLKAVKEDDWLKVFSLWHNPNYGNTPGWVDFMLCDLLYFLDIDFWNYLPSENLENYIYIAYGKVEDRFKKL